MSRLANESIRKWRAYFSAYAALPGDTYAGIRRIGSGSDAILRLYGASDKAAQSPRAPPERRIADATPRASKRRRLNFLNVRSWRKLLFAIKPPWETIAMPAKMSQTAR